MRALLFIHLLALFTVGFCVRFVNPPPFGAVSDFSLNAIYVEGSVVNIQWIPGEAENRMSLTMFQLNGTRFLEPFEYLTHNVPSNTSSLSWTVNTSKDLSISNMFYLCIFIEGESASVANSHYFNITGTAIAASIKSASSTESTSSTDSTSSTQLTSSTEPPSPAETTSSTQSISTISDTQTTNLATESTSTSTTAITSSPPSGLGIGAKAGIGIGIAAAVILGIVAGWFIFGRRKRQSVDLLQKPAIKTGYYEPEKLQEQRHHWTSEGTVVPPVYVQEQRRQLSDESTIAPRMYEQGQRRNQLRGEGIVAPQIHEGPQRNQLNGQIYEMPDYRVL